MTHLNRNFYLTSLFAILTAFSFSQNIEEKTASLSEISTKPNNWEDKLTKLNQALKQQRLLLKEKYDAVAKLVEKQAPEETYRELLLEVNQLKHAIEESEASWKALTVTASRQEEDAYGFWDQEDTTFSQLIMEYGANDYLYLIPPEILTMKFNMHSGLPIPRESWSELLEIILTQNGIGIKQLNPYARQLYLLKQDLLTVDVVANNPKDLKKVPANTRMVYVFSPAPEQAKSVGFFFERFRDPKRTFIYQVGLKVAIVAMKEEVEKLLSLYDAVWEKETEKVTKVISLKKMSTGDMEKILRAYFGDLADKNRMPMMKSGDDLSIMPLGHEASLVLVGMKEMVKKAEEIIKETESQISNPCEMTVHWYTCRHSDPVDIANVLEKVYVSLIFSGTEGGEKDLVNREFPNVDPELNLQYPQPPITYGPPGPAPIVNAPTVIPGKIEDQKKKTNTFNFIPYPKTGAVMMVIRRDTLEKIKELVKKLDVPKKMVHIEVMLFEKTIKNKNNFGLNLLKMGSLASNTQETGAQYEAQPGTLLKGVLQFIMSRKSSKHFPAFDIAYNFLMSQEDIRINASPSVTTVNQVPAKVSIVEELSVNNGAAPIETSNGTIAFENSYTRNQYGINIVMTPTIHEADPEDTDEHRFITLETHVNFDTINSDINDRPKVNRRSVENQVRVLDGETVILGGLRKKTGEDNTEKIPFLGEIPGIAKFFGTSRLTDELTEMIIFITPRILLDSKAEMEKFRQEELKKRPGDVPEFLQRVLDARRLEKRKVFENSVKLLFGTNESNFRSM
ncbi:MAG: secretin N-terminal domain-containing protein [Chlamydiota bacterium]